MRMIVVRLVSPPAQLYGYLRRFMLEMEIGLLVGSCTKPIIDEIVQAMHRRKVEGFVLLADSTSETGFIIPYFQKKGWDLEDFDGVFLAKKLLQSNC